MYYLFILFKISFLLTLITIPFILSLYKFSIKLYFIQKKLKDFAHLYEAIKEERNNCLSSIQLSNQHIQELSEKLRISANEIDILKNNLVHKEELTNKQRKNIEKVIAARDLLRNEFSKLVCFFKNVSKLYMYAFYVI